MKKRYFITGSTKKGWKIVDDLTPGMPAVEEGIPRKWVAESKCDDLNKHWEKTQKKA